MNIIRLSSIITVFNLINGDVFQILNPGAVNVPAGTAGYAFKARHIG